MIVSGAAIELDDVFKVYKEGPIETVALRGVSIRITAGEYVALCGPSGCGKSTLLNLVAGFALPTAGRIRVAGADLGGQTEAERSRMRRIFVGLVFQSDNLLQRLTVLENVQLPARLAGCSDARGLAVAALTSVGVEGLGSRYPAQLSGGERQRVAIAAGIALSPAILLADEVTGELDSQTGQVVLDLLTRLNQEHGLTILAVTHSQKAASRAHRVIDMEDGAIRQLELAQ
ncbi:MAG: ABC transporter ATP-binding protein [Tepidiformaceae bacterium]